MNRVLRLAPNLGTVALVFALRNLSFDPARLRPITLALAIFTGGCAAWLARRREASPIDAALAGFVLLGAAGIWLWPGGLGEAVAARPTAWLFGTLLAVATVPQLAGWEPFTAFFARRRAPDAVWETEIFRGIVREMAWVWAGLFALALLLSLAPAPRPRQPATRSLRTPELRRRRP